MKKLNIEFSETFLSKNSGLYLVSLFAEKLSLCHYLKNTISIQRGTNAKYHASDVILVLIMNVIAGAKHISQCNILRNDNVVRTFLDWEKYPDDRTIGRLFEIFTHKHCIELSEVERNIRNQVWSIKWFGRITLDLDSTVKGVYGNQEGAEKGYNSRKRGQKSYHPLLCFIAENRECLHNWLRPGSTYTSNGSVQFVQECFSKIPKRVWKIFVRADSGFFAGHFLEYLENNKCEYLIKVKMRNLKKLLLKQKWRKIGNDILFETCQFSHKCQNWNKARKFLAIRKFVKMSDENMLFPTPVYEYFCYVSNRDLSPMKAHKCYGKRATSENWIDWCKNHMASGNILKNEFWSNSAIFQCCILAYNLLAWMMWINTRGGFNEEPNTIRSKIITVPGRLIHSGRAWTLKLPTKYVFKEQIETMIESINAIKLDT
ncbi:MAG: transposase (IS4 family protein) [Candidatus Magnetoglobus multicellularis str. Araruama]|uniref:Transposase (IS4 family protein) n=1 Tax=Candidatus Magnetoglobus multicellularis str. Araruama TaxID=890399 RepID=A0A1V1NW14_9BACT|nr:MAG: transposase (IS4 family protein) [Candidatus Magnetoglobus multicellularis str. Araruama]